MHYRLTPDESGLGQGLDVIEERLTSYGLKRKEITKSMLATEEVMSALLEHADNALYVLQKGRENQYQVKQHHYAFESLVHCIMYSCQMLHYHTTVA